MGIKDFFKRKPKPEYTYGSEDMAITSGKQTLQPITYAVSNHKFNTAKEALNEARKYKQKHPNEKVHILKEVNIFGMRGSASIGTVKKSLKPKRYWKRKK